MTLQLGWPIGMPLAKKLEPGLWELRSRITSGNARVLFAVEDDCLVLLHAFVKKTKRTPLPDLRTARERLAKLRSQ